jgi:hypothetical protein
MARRTSLRRLGSAPYLSSTTTVLTHLPRTGELNIETRACPRQGQECQMQSRTVHNPPTGLVQRRVLALTGSVDVHLGALEQEAHHVVVVLAARVVQRVAFVGVHDFRRRTSLDQLLHAHELARVRGWRLVSKALIAESRVSRLFTNAPQCSAVMPNLWREQRPPTVRRRSRWYQTNTEVSSRLARRHVRGAF